MVKTFAYKVLAEFAETQIKSKDTNIVRETFKRLLINGVSASTAEDRIIGVIAEYFYMALNDNNSFDVSGYEAALRELE